MGIGVLGLGCVVLALNSFLLSPTPVLKVGFVPFLYVTLTNFERSDVEAVTAAADPAEPLGSTGGTLFWVPSVPRAVVALLLVSCAFFSCFV